jgi:hypothetical protein
MMDRKIVEALMSGKSVRTVCRELRTGNRRVAKLEKLAREAGYLDGSVPQPSFPKALFSEADRKATPQSDPDLKLEPHIAWICERFAADWHKVTLFEELPVRVSRSSFYRFLDRRGLGVENKPERVVPEIVHHPGEALLLDWGHLCTIECPETGRKRIVWAFMGVLGFSAPSWITSRNPLGRQSIGDAADNTARSVPRCADQWATLVQIFVCRPFPSSSILKDSIMTKSVAFTICLFSVTALSCVPRKFNQSSGTRSDGEQGFTFKKYASMCKAELGDAPQFDCEKMWPIPSTRNGIDVHWEVVTSPHRSSDDKTKCDATSATAVGDYDKAGCLPGQTYQYVTTDHRAADGSSQKVDWVAICRRFDPEIGPGDASKAEGKWYNLGIFGTNRITGATCVGEAGGKSIMKAGEYKRDVRIINGAPLAADGSILRMTDDDGKYFTFGENCSDCHNSQPVLRSPFLSQLKDKGNNPYPPIRAGLPYWLVAADQLKAHYKKNFPKGYPGAQASGGYSTPHFEPWTPIRLKGEAVSACTTCHDIGGRDQCRLLLPQAFDLQLVDGVNSLTPYEWPDKPEYYKIRYQVGAAKDSRSEKYFSAPKTDLEREWPDSGWHNKLIRAAVERQGKSAPDYRKSLNKVVECCKNPDAAGCEWEHTRLGTAR